MQLKCPSAFPLSMHKTSEKSHILKGQDLNTLITFTASIRTFENESGMLLFIIYVCTSTNKLLKCLQFYSPLLRTTPSKCQHSKKKK